MTMILILYLFLSQILTKVHSSNPLLASSDVTNVKQSRKGGGGHQSLTLLMNFKNDGTTSFQIMQGNSLLK